MIQQTPSAAVEPGVITVLMVHVQRFELVRTISAAFWFLGKHEDYARWAWSFITGCCAAGGVAGLRSCKQSFWISLYRGVGTPRRFSHRTPSAAQRPPSFHSTQAKAASRCYCNPTKSDYFTVQTDRGKKK